MKTERHGKLTEVLSAIDRHGVFRTGLVSLYHPAIRLLPVCMSCRGGTFLLAPAVRIEAYAV